MNKKIFWIAAIILAWFGRDGARAQQKQPVTSIQADCQVFFTLSVASSGAQATPWLPSQATPPAGSAGTSLVIDNAQAGCYGWTLDYKAHGFSAVSLHFQSAPDNAGGTAPGTWSDMVVVSTALGGLGINPNTAITQALTATTGYFPWLRMNLTSKTGTGAVTGTLYGFKRNTSAKSGGGGSGGCPAPPLNSIQFNLAGICAGSANLTSTAGGNLSALAHNAMGPLGLVNGNGPTLYTTGDTPTAYASINTLKQSIGNVGTTVQTSQSNWTIIAPVGVPANEAVRSEVNYIETSTANAINGQIVASFNQVDHYGTGNMPNDSAAVNAYFFNRDVGLITRSFGTDGQSVNLAGGTVTTAVGARGVSQNVGAGTIANGYGGYFYSENDGSGVVTNSVGIWIFPTPNFGTGTITNGYGIYIRAPENDSAVPVTRSVAWFNENQVQAGITAPFSWYSEGGTNHMETGGAAVVGMEIEAAVAQTANLFQCLASNGITVNCAWGPDGRLLLHSIAFASLATPGNGSAYYCTDCTVTSGIDNTCKATGAGAFAERVNGVWKCNL